MSALHTNIFFCFFLSARDKYNEHARLSIPGKHRNQSSASNLCEIWQILSPIILRALHTNLFFVFSCGANEKQSIAPKHRNQSSPSNLCEIWRKLNPIILRRLPSLIASQAAMGYIHQKNTAVEEFLRLGLPANLLNATEMSFSKLVTRDVYRIWEEILHKHRD